MSKVPVIGVWDDHDYGNNNGGKVKGDAFKTVDLSMSVNEVKIKSKIIFNTGNNSMIFGSISFFSLS